MSYPKHCKKCDKLHPPKEQRDQGYIFFHILSDGERAFTYWFCSKICLCTYIIESIYITGFTDIVRYLLGETEQAKK